MLHDAIDDVYHWYVYGLVPVVGVEAVRVTVWPLSIDAGDGLTVDATSAVFTVTVSTDEYWCAGVLAESVTSKQ